MKKFNDLSVKEKLISITTFTAIVAILLVLISNLLFTYLGFKKNTGDSLTSFARIVGTNCSAAILFEDNEAANTTLNALKTELQIERARIYLPTGVLFAEYIRDNTVGSQNESLPNYCDYIKNESMKSNEFKTTQIIYTKGKVVVMEPIFMENRLIGIVEIQSDKRALYGAMGAILIVNLIILLIASILAVIISSKANKTISGPVTQLTDTVVKVSRDKDYSVRIKKQSKDELGTLFDMFNEMLSEIQERDDRLQFIQYSIDHMQDAIIWTDSSARIVSSNNKACELLGYAKDEILSMTLFDLYSGLTPETWKESWEYILGEKNISAETETKRKDGTSFPTEVFVSNIEFNGKGYNCSFIRDISDKKILRAQLEQAQKMEAIGTLAGGVAHDLNNILGGLVGYPDLLLIDIPEDSPMIRPLETIKKSGEKAAAIVQDLLTLARRNIDIKKVVNINNVITDYMKSPEHLRIREFYPDVAFHVRLNEDLPNIMGSEVHLSKVIMNLVSNAAEAMPDGKGEVFISTNSCFLDSDYHGFQDIMQGRYSIVSVEDKGSGISNEEKRNIFEPFYTKKVMGRSGTGLGMTVVSGVVKDHLGYIDIESAEGKGTKFDLYFPVTEQQIIEELKNNFLESCRGSEKILVVDDVEEQRELALYTLSRLGYEVDTVPSGEEAISYLQSNSADLIVLDMIMEPGMDGLETYKKILKITPGQKAIIASGFAENRRVKETLKLGAGNYVKKPYTAINLGTAVRTELDRRQ